MTQACIWGAIFFVDCATRWLKVHIMQDTLGNYTLESKEAFERDCMNLYILPKKYHADTGQFTENTFKQYYDEKYNILLSVALVLINKIAFPNGL